jgi:hypothetical protein
VNILGENIGKMEEYQKNYEKSYQEKFVDIRDKVKDFFYHLPCKFGLHEITETRGFWKFGKCKRCGIEGMFY